jgi:hypothetical protein
MATEEPASTFLGGKPNILPAMTFDEVKARAQRMLDRFGPPPYEQYGTPGMGDLGADAVAVISDFVHFWLPYLVEKEKPSGS